MGCRQLRDGTMSTDRLQYERIVRERERREITGVPTSTWYDLQSRGLAPRPVPISTRTCGWLLSDLQDFIAERVNKRKDEWQSLGDAAARVIHKSRRENK
jgi:prophage regulatory protein